MPKQPKEGFSLQARDRVDNWGKPKKPTEREERMTRLVGYLTLAGLGVLGLGILLEWLAGAFR